MAKLAVGDQFPVATLKDIEGASVEFPTILSEAPSAVVSSTVFADDPGARPSRLARASVSEA